VQIDGQPDRTVSYSTDVYQDQIEARDEMVGGLFSYDNINIPGIDVWFGEALLILEDGKKMRILIDSNGIRAMSGPK
jgi:hypothetical protein